LILVWEKNVLENSKIIKNYFPMKGKISFMSLSKRIVYESRLHRTLSKEILKKK
jgi:hypothetical protein